MLQGLMETETDGITAYLNYSHTGVEASVGRITTNVVVSPLNRRDIISYMDFPPKNPSRMTRVESFSQV